MIDRRELMQGNIVKPIGYLYEMKPIEYCIVDGFSDDGVFIDGIRGMGLIDYSEIEPIPITPEWLERMGFEKVGEQYRVALPNGLYIYYWRTAMPEFILDVYGNRAPLWGIKHLHHFQNAFYYITGEELQIKEKTN